MSDKSTRLFPLFCIELSYNPPITNMDKQVSRTYFNEQAAHWDDAARNNDAKKLHAMADRLKIPARARVLDVGTGTGVFLPYIKEKVHQEIQIICVDFAFNMLALARGRNTGDRIGYICAEIETLGFLPDLFDAVVCYSAFPHFHDKPGSLLTIHRLLKPGGRLYISHTASRETINQIHSNISDLQDHLLPGREEMAALIRQSGFLAFEIDEQPDSYLASAIK